MSCHKTKKKSESQWGNEPQTFKATETLWWVKLIQSSLMICVLHTARISNVDRVMFVNRIRWYVMSLVKKKRNLRCFSSCHECGKKGKILSPKNYLLSYLLKSVLFTHQTNSDNKEADTLDGQMSCAFLLFFLFLSKIKNVIQHRSWKTDHFQVFNNHAFQIIPITS